MQRVASIRHEEFVKLYSDKYLYYGGDQSWFSIEDGRNCSCGCVAAANVLTYLSEHNGKYRKLGLKAYENRADYTVFLHILYKYIYPLRIFGRCIGIWPGIRIIRGIRRFLKAYDIVPEFRCRYAGFSQSRLIDFITESLNADRPLLMLIGFNKRITKITVDYGEGKSVEDMNKHWLSITELLKDDEGEYFVKVSSWGGSSYIKLSDWNKGFWPDIMIELK